MRMRGAGAGRLLPLPYCMSRSRVPLLQTIGKSEIVAEERATARYCPCAVVMPT